MRETLEKINANQENIVKLLLQMTHAEKGPKIYANKEDSGSHGDNWTSESLQTSSSRGGGHYTSMGSSLSLVVANIFMEHFKTLAINPSHIKTKCWL
jgi:hypothetical protein